MSDATDPATEAAWAYERLHVDALFRQWTEPVLAAAGVGPGDHVLDVACGTGVLARAALDLVGGDGAVTGVDLGDGMLAVASQLEPRVTWRSADAASLPFDDNTFDAVVSQFGLMFFDDKVTSIREMLRCARPGAKVAVAVWDALERSPAFATSVDLLERRAGQTAADALRAPFVLGAVTELHTLLGAAGADVVSTHTASGTARFPSVRSMVEADLRGWLPLMGVELDGELIESILDDADIVLNEYVADDGAMEFAVKAHIVTVGGQPGR